MAANGSKTAVDDDMAECDGEKVVTMMDVLQEQEDFEEDANAVLGASDDKNCTYSKGYVRRQALYACLTCCPEAKENPTKRAGVCLACSLNCHENHELIELYTKRNFRCDCGNPKFNSHPCTFTPNKSDINYDNKYNQNFSGLYCICHRPYPDPESTEEDEMIQCIVCEDWLHTNHLDATVPSNDQYAEMVCKDCMEDNDFLHDYTDIVINTVDKEIIVSDPDLDISGYLENVKGQEQSKLLNGTSENCADSREASPAKSDNKDAESEGHLNTSKEDTDKNEDSANIESSEVNEEKPKGKEGKMEKEQTEISAETDIDKKTQNDDSQIDSSTNDTELNAEISTETGDPVESAQNGDSQIDSSTNETESNENEETKAATTGVAADSNTEIKPNDTGNSNDTSQNKDTEMTGEKQEVAKVPEVDEKSQDNKRKLTEETENSAIKKQKIETCIRPRGVKRLYKGATFWPANLRQKLCTCLECVAMYKDLAVMFLIDADDTVTAYEALGKERIDGPSSQYEKGLQALSSLDRIQQINALTEYNKMRDKLLDFLKSFKDRKEIVKEEDIKAFFAGMKPKREPDGVYFCR